MGSASVNKKKLFYTISQQLEKLAVGIGQNFPENSDARKGKFWIVEAGFQQA